MSEPTRQPPVQEPDHVDGRDAVTLWVGTILVVAVCAALAFVAIRLTEPDPGAAFPAVRGRVGTNGPRTLYTTGTHATGPDSATRARMEGYAWRSADHSVAAIPIEEAMRILAGDTAAADSPAGRDTTVAAPTTPPDSSGGGNR